MHAAIVKNFKKYHLFGFTGTPIFAKNATTVKNSQFLTTEQTFGDPLHAYTIVDAINDKNVAYCVTLNGSPSGTSQLLWWTKRFICTKS